MYSSLEYKLSLYVQCISTILTTLHFQNVSGMNPYFGGKHNVNLIWYGTKAGLGQAVVWAVKRERERERERES